MNRFTHAPICGGRVGVGVISEVIVTHVAILVGAFVTVIVHALGMMRMVFVGKKLFMQETASTPG